MRYDGILSQDESYFSINLINYTVKKVRKFTLCLTEFGLLAIIKRPIMKEKNNI